MTRFARHTPPHPAPEAARDASPDALARRVLFPRGLVQPPGGFRFGADTLLLAAFAARCLPAGTRPAAGLDLGTGCGAASLGLLLLRGDLDLRLTGIDSAPEMAAAASANALALGLAHRFRAELDDVRAYCPAGAHPGFDLALANPPFRRPGTGRICPEEAKNSARFEGPEGFAAFAACAARCLRPRGRFFVVHLAERLPELLRTLEDHGLAARRVLPVQGRQGQNPRLALLDCQRGGRPGGFSLLAPLVLYASDNSLTPEAEAFCPPLAANPRRAGVSSGCALAKDNDAE